VDDAVQHLLVAKAGAVAHVGRVVRDVGHGLEAARHHYVALAEHDLLRRQHHALHATGAHLVCNG